MSNYKTKLHKIKAFAFDVDGVLTDGTFISMSDGDLVRVFNAKDGFGMRMALLNGYHIAIITGGASESIVKRFLPMGMDPEDIYMKSRNKIPDFETFCTKHSVNMEEVAFIGDDIPDIPILKVCGLAVCPSDAVAEVKEVCDFVSLYPGGKGCARDLIEQVLKVQNRWIFDCQAYSG
jgi:3-deoxy-D-manno-octulosonate 8-phosphate phosphatase (KDO 8-P phosphatase)